MAPFWDGFIRVFIQWVIEFLFGIKEEEEESVVIGKKWWTRLHRRSREKRRIGYLEKKFLSSIKFRDWSTRRTIKRN